MPSLVAVPGAAAQAVFVQRQSSAPNAVQRQSSAPALLAPPQSVHVALSNAGPLWPSGRGTPVAVSPTPGYASVPLAAPMVAASGHAVVRMSSTPAVGPAKQSVVLAPAGYGGGGGGGAPAAGRWVVESLATGSVVGSPMGTMHGVSSVQSLPGSSFASPWPPSPVPAPASAPGGGGGGGVPAAVAATAGADGGEGGSWEPVPVGTARSMATSVPASSSACSPCGGKGIAGIAGCTLCHALLSVFAGRLRVQTVTPARSLPELPVDLADRALSCRLSEEDEAAAASSLCRYHGLHKRRYEVWARCQLALQRCASAGGGRRELDRVQRLGQELSSLESQVKKAEPNFLDGFKGYLRQLQQDVRDNLQDTLVGRARELVGAWQAQIDEVDDQIRQRVDERRSSMASALDRCLDNAREEFWRVEEKRVNHKLLGCLASNARSGRRGRGLGESAQMLKEMAELEQAKRLRLERQAESQAAVKVERVKERKDRDMNIWLSKMDELQTLQHLQATKDHELIFSRVEMTLRRLDEDQVIELRQISAHAVKHVAKLLGINEGMHTNVRCAGDLSMALDGDTNTLAIEPFLYCALRHEFSADTPGPSGSPTPSSSMQQAFGDLSAQGEAGGCSVELMAFAEFVGARFLSLSSVVAAIDLTGTGRLTCFELESWLSNHMYPGDARRFLREIDRGRHGRLGVADLLPLVGPFLEGGLRYGRPPGSAGAALAKRFRMSFERGPLGRDRLLEVQRDVTRFARRVLAFVTEAPLDGHGTAEELHLGRSAWAESLVSCSRADGEPGQASPAAAGRARHMLWTAAESRQSHMRFAKKEVTSPNVRNPGKAFRVPPTRQSSLPSLRSPHGGMDAQPRLPTSGPGSAAVGGGLAGKMRGAPPPRAGAGGAPPPRCGAAGGGSASSSARCSPSSARGASSDRRGGGAGAGNHSARGASASAKAARAASTERGGGGSRTTNVERGGGGYDTPQRGPPQGSPPGSTGGIGASTAAKADTGSTPCGSPSPFLVDGLKDDPASGGLGQASARFEQVTLALRRQVSARAGSPSGRSPRASSPGASARQRALSPRGGGCGGGASAAAAELVQVRVASGTAAAPVASVARAAFAVQLAVAVGGGSSGCSVASAAAGAASPSPGLGQPLLVAQAWAQALVHAQAQGSHGASGQTEAIGSPASSGALGAPFYVLGAPVASPQPPRGGSCAGAAAFAATVLGPAASSPPVLPLRVFSPRRFPPVAMPPPGSATQQGLAAAAACINRSASSPRLTSARPIVAPAWVVQSNTAGIQRSSSSSRITSVGMSPPVSARITSLGMSPPAFAMFPPAAFASPVTYRAAAAASPAAASPQGGSSVASAAAGGADADDTVHL